MPVYSLIPISIPIPTLIPIPSWRVGVAVSGSNSLRHAATTHNERDCVWMSPHSALHSSLLCTLHTLHKILYTPHTLIAHCSQLCAAAVTLHFYFPSSLHRQSAAQHTICSWHDTYSYVCTIPRVPILSKHKHL